MSNDIKTRWDGFVIDNDGSFLQSYEWGEFQESLGRKIWRIEISDTLKALVIKHNLPFNKSYLYCPRGPVLFNERQNDDSITDFVRKTWQIAQNEDSIFLKVESSLNLELARFGFIKSKKQIQPSQTIILNLNLSEEELLEQMHPKTRYNIKLAERKGVIIEETENSGLINVFLELIKQTAQRDRFHTHSENYYKKMIDILGKEEMIKLFLAKYQDKIIAANLICFYGDGTTYLHGASDHTYRQVMAPSLLQWQIILEAKKRGFKYYDFWGIDENRWPGVTRFKHGFGGREVFYSGSFDYIFQSIWYRGYRLGRKFL